MSGFAEPCVLHTVQGKQCLCKQCLCKQMPGWVELVVRGRKEVAGHKIVDWVGVREHFWKAGMKLRVAVDALST